MFKFNPLYLHSHLLMVDFDGDLTRLDVVKGKYSVIIDFSSSMVKPV